MKSLFWRFVFYVVLPLVMAVAFIYPPTPRDLVATFAENAAPGRRDATLNEIVTQARKLQTERKDQDFANLREAIGTNDIAKYFPQFTASQEKNPTLFILNKLQRKAAGKVKLGIDLQGGTSYLVEMDMTQLANTNESAGALSQAVEVLRKRVDQFGVAEPIIQPAGDNQILVQLPGLSEAVKEEAKMRISQAAFLEFRLVHEQSQQILERGEPIPPGHEVMRSRPEKQRDGKERSTTVVVRKKPELTGSAVKSAMVIRGNLGEPQINFTMTSDGAVKFADLTKKNIGRGLAIVLDKELYSAPVIQSAIETGSGQITGTFEPAEALRLASILENPLRAPLKIVESQEVGATLGADSIQSGYKSAIYGVLAVSVFMLVYYLLAGMVANVALILNVIILIAAMCAVDTTFTLPGIAGIVLTVGMAVDANVLIYERIREERAKGKSLRGAIAAGYDRAFGTIFDSHVTTLISSIILIWLGTGPIKGFGVALSIGVAASLFTALLVTRVIFDFLLERNLLKELRMLHIIRTTKIDFMKWALPAFVASWALILVGNGYGIFVRGKDVMGVEFTGGSFVKLGYDQSQKMDIGTVRESIHKLGIGDFMVVEQKDVGGNQSTFRVTTRVQDEKKVDVEPTNKRVLAQLNQDFPAAKFVERGSGTVGPTMGDAIRDAAILSGIIAMFGILAYVAFRYEFSFAVAAIIAIVHDLLMTSGVYFMAQKQMNATTVAALLTIIGFSINDTIVIFDRIREDLKLGVRGTFRELVNQALNQTLSRTIITSGTVFIATMSLYIFGGGEINDFAFAFLVGILTGTYSSIYIASAIVLWWHKGQRPQLGGSQVVVEAESTTAPASLKS
jgi:SecD/SecF fusion protein